MNNSKPANSSIIAVIIGLLVFAYLIAPRNGTTLTPVAVCDIKVPIPHAKAHVFLCTTQVSYR
jgi:hypothetical protein